MTMDYPSSDLSMYEWESEIDCVIAMMNDTTDPTRLTMLANYLTKILDKLRYNY